MQPAKKQRPLKQLTAAAAAESEDWQAVACRSACRILH